MQDVPLAGSVEWALDGRGRDLLFGGEPLDRVSINRPKTTLLTIEWRMWVACQGSLLGRGVRTKGVTLRVTG
jgi:hypothetical protein